MYLNYRKTNPIVKMMNAMLIDMPAPLNISIWWNFGSLLGLCLMLHIISGLFMALHYSGHVNWAFDNLFYICRDVNNGWLIRSIHANGASMFFICLYLHISRGLYFNSYMLIHTWLIGVTILLVTMATAFLGYVLPWGQMSLWGACVITNLLSTIPYLGPLLVQWLWGGFSVDTPTLTRFFTLHFMLPFIILAMMFIHITFLHQTGSKNPLGLKSSLLKITFHPYFVLKDILGVLILLWCLILLSLWNHNMLGDPENFNSANPLNSPPHIQPEWYYLFAYSILRSIPNKLGGVIALDLSISIFNYNQKRYLSLQFYPVNIFMVWLFFSVVILLTCIGAKPVQDPYIFTGQILTLVYYSYFVTESWCTKWWEL